jgi:hypothetical protein
MLDLNQVVDASGVRIAVAPLEGELMGAFLRRIEPFFGKKPLCEVLNTTESTMLVSDALTTKEKTKKKKKDIAAEPVVQWVHDHVPELVDTVTGTVLRRKDLRYLTAGETRLLVGSVNGKTFDSQFLRPFAEMHAGIISPFADNRSWILLTFSSAENRQEWLIDFDEILEACPKRCFGPIKYLISDTLKEMYPAYLAFLTGNSKLLKKFEEARIEHDDLVASLEAKDGIDDEKKDKEEEEQEEVPEQILHRPALKKLVLPKPKKRVREEECEDEDLDPWHVAELESDENGDIPFTKKKKHRVFFKEPIPPSPLKVHALLN